MDLQLPRSSGILLHPTSLPGKFGIGTLGKEAYDFIDFLKASGQKLWQIFPLGPTGYGDSPYQCFSAFAGNPLLISLEKLQKAGWLSPADLITTKKFNSKKVEFGKVIDFKMPLLNKAYDRFVRKASHSQMLKFEAFCHNRKDWLDDYALFMALKDRYQGRPWWEWDSGIRSRNVESVKKYRSECREKIAFYKFLQYQFFDQWFELHVYAKRNHVRLIGDVPIFVAHDSADTWSNPGLFFLDKDLKPTKVAGVPPDYFSKTGQLWGNPLYRWSKMKESGYRWWIRRLSLAFELTDHVRLDHFRGFCAYWAVPFGDKTAVNGKWENGPGIDLFLNLEKALGKLPIIAEDLGVITPDVVELRDKLGFPGMKILQFAFDSNEKNDYLPHRYHTHCVVYTGTHDNDTTKGWFNKTSVKDRKFASDYLRIPKTKNISWEFIRAAWASVAAFAIAPLQDLLNLGSDARMNLPGSTRGNWQWRFKKSDLGSGLAEKVKLMTKTFERG